MPLAPETVNLQMFFMPTCHLGVHPGWLGFAYTESDCGRRAYWHCLANCVVVHVLIGLVNVRTFLALRRQNKMCVLKDEVQKTVTKTLQTHDQWRLDALPEAARAGAPLPGAGGAHRALHGGIKSR